MIFIRAYWSILWFLTFIFGRRKSCNKCGKTTRRAIRLHDDDLGTFHIKQPKDECYCTECFDGMKIRCAWCGKSIPPGSPVTLYVPNKEDVREGLIPEYAVVYKQKPLQLVGCLRSSCSHGIDRAGFWVPPGEVQRVLTPIEEVMMKIQGGEDGVMIFNDLSDPSQTIPVPKQ